VHLDRPPLEVAELTRQRRVEIDTLGRHGRFLSAASACCCLLLPGFGGEPPDHLPTVRVSARVATCLDSRSVQGSVGRTTPACEAASVPARTCQ
jgi:hypothetical protein